MTAQFRVGDRVKAVLGKTVVEGEVVLVYPSAIDVRPEGATVGILYVPTDGTDGWTVEVLPEPEPPTRTVVLDRCGIAWQRHGSWWHSASGIYVSDFDDLDFRYGPITLLEVAS